MEIKRRLLALLFALSILCAISVPASALEVPDTTRNDCSIQVTMSAQDAAVPGGSLTLYRVGEVAENNGDYSFTLTAAFAGSGLDLDDLTADLAQKLAQYAANNGVSGVTKDIGTDGKVSFTGLETGLYLLAQDEAASGYNKANPFLVSLPLYNEENGSYSYEVDASPKVEELEKTPATPQPSPQPTERPGRPGWPGTGGSRLPQTGQMNWPVPVLVVLGLVLFSAGWVLRFGKKNGYEE